jgi:hypothetical protein
MKEIFNEKICESKSVIIQEFNMLYVRFEIDLDMRG